MPHPIDTGTNHIGFRCVVRVEPEVEEVGKTSSLTTDD
jgi:hypothetical protein